MAISSRGAERMSSMQSLSAYMLIAAPFSNLNMNLAEMNFFTSSLFFFFSFCTRTQTALLLTSSIHLSCAAGWDLRWTGALWDMRNCGFPMILLFDSVLSWHSKYSSYFRQRSSEASGGAYVFCTDANARFWSLCQRGYPVTRAYHTRCKKIYGFKLTNPPLLEIIQSLQKGLQFTLHCPSPILLLLAAHKPTISYGETCTRLSHVVSNENILTVWISLLYFCTNNGTVPVWSKKRIAFLIMEYCNKKKGNCDYFVKWISVSEFKVTIKRTILANHETSPATFSLL